MIIKISYFLQPVKQQSKEMKSEQMPNFAQSLNPNNPAQVIIYVTWMFWFCLNLIQMKMSQQHQISSNCV